MPSAHQRPGALALAAAALAAALAAASCVSPENVGHGLLAVKARGTLQHATTPAPAGAREGRAESYAFLHLFAHGDASLDAAIRQGGLTRVHHVDHEAKSVLFGLLAVYTTIAVGE